MGNAVLQRLVDERQQIDDNINQILDSVNEEDRSPSESERGLLSKLRTRLVELEPQIGEMLDFEETRSKAHDARAVLSRGGETPAPPKPDDDDEGGGGDGEYQTFAHYARDVMITRFSKIGAQVDMHTRSSAEKRLQRAVEQVLVASVTGLAMPQHLQQIVDVIDKSRPIVTTSRQVSLTSGKIQFPKIVNRPDVAEQVTEKTEVGDGSMQVNMLEAIAKSYLTSANFSWQVVQWGSPDAMALWFDLAAESYARQTDAYAASLLAAADATPTAVTANTIEAWTTAITAAAGAIYVATGRYANTIYADPVTGYEILGLTSAVAPIFLSTGGGDLSSGRFPTVGGLQLVISRGLPADTAIVGDSSALLTAETPGSPVELRAVEPSIGGIEVGIIGAFAASAVDATAFSELTPPA